MSVYNPKDIEKKWQEVWEKESAFVFQEKSEKPKYYALDMFPYPSADGLHVGHPLGYTATDIIARFQRMRGYNVLHPIGWDAFGLPAENYAIKTGTHPAETTQKSIKNFTRQIRALGFSYDWSREISTADPEYYRWTQWLFLYLYEKGLAYQKEAPVNWCPSCQTVLANEQVVHGHCERCDSEVEQRNLKQWFFKITEYADRLLDELEEVDWPEPIKTMQRNWIGRSEGAELKFPISNSQFSITTFTTRPDTLFGATYLVLAPEHAMVEKLADRIENTEEVVAYKKQAQKKTERERLAEEKEKTGVQLTGVSAINPATKEEIPIFIADYVLAGYGTGAIMAVPAHDARDHAFAQKHNLTIRQVIAGEELPYTREGALVRSGTFDGMASHEARDAITKHVGGEKKVQYKLRDWLVSRQRYWGAPIPIIHCEQCGAVPVPEEDLPVELPMDVDFKPTGESPLNNHPDFADVSCPKCSGKARREADTMDTFVDSSWYFLRYIDPQNTKKPFDEKKAKEVMPVDVYVGGAEHAVLHLLYARFITKALSDGKMFPYTEPFLQLRNQGMILGPDGHRMSKSRGNVVNPDEVLEEYGADAFRLYEMFMGPFEDEKPWDIRNIIGVFRFLTRVWKLTNALKDLPADKRIEESTELRQRVHQTIVKVEHDITHFRFNTVVSALMELLSAIEKEQSTPAFRTFLVLLYPFAPHLSAEAWERLSFKGYIHEAFWPEADEQYLVQEEIQLVVQVNGKVRDTITLPAGLSDDELRTAAEQSENAQKHLSGKEVRQVVVVPDKVVNFVTQ